MTNTIPVSELKGLIGKAAEISAGEVRIASLVNGTRMQGSALAETRVSPLNQGLTFTSEPLNEAETLQAIQAVRQGFDHGEWGRFTARDRSRVLWRAAELVEASTDRLVELLMIEAGKPAREATGEVGALVNSLEYFAGAARSVNGRTEDAIDPNLLAMTLREPAGVAGLIIPWNFPLGILAQKLAPALAAGNTVVLKPSPLTPLSALAVAELLFKAGLPVDALSIVVGDAEAGAAIVEAHETDVVSFTGSTGVGRKIVSSASNNRLKPVAVEAGGKTPVIVLDDADLESTVEGILFSAYFNQGQVCVAGSRIMAQRGIADRLTSRLAERADEIIVGDPRAESTELGPMISTAHFEQVTDKVAASIEAGAKLVTERTPEAIDNGSAGPFMPPTVLQTDDDKNLAIQDEFFGPVTTVQTFDDVWEAVERANSQAYGLAASVWGTSTDQLLSITRGLRVGTVWINGSTDSYPELPLGGRRDSGFAPEFGREGLEFFTVLKTVMIRTGGPAAGWYGAR